MLMVYNTAMAYPLLLHAKHRGSDVTYHPFGPWVVPWVFDGVEAEYQALRTGVGLLDYSTQAIIQVDGADRVSFLHNLLTNDIKRLSPGSGCPAALLTASAKLVTDLIVLADADSMWLLCDATRAATMMQTLERYLFSEQVTLTNYERRSAVLALQGPRTIELLTQCFGRVVALPNACDHVVLPLQGVPVRVIRDNLACGVGVLCVVEADKAPMVWELLLRRGRPAGLKLVGWEALNIARIEAGLPWFGMDMNEDHLLPETGLESVAVSDTKGCYLGQEIIARLQTYGSANKKLMGLLIEGAEVPQAGDRIERGGETLGGLTSACYSLALKRPIAMGYVKRGAYEPGTAVEIVRKDARLAATVMTRPLVPQT